jgi:Xaa-Pro aminopeptidase
MGGMDETRDSETIPMRTRRLAGELADFDVQALLVQSSTDVRYLSGFTGSNGLVLVTAETGGHRFLTDFRYVSQSEAQVPATFEREIVTGELLDAVPGLLGGGGGRLGFDDSQMTVRAHRRLAERLPDGWELVACPPLVSRLRAVKSEEEIGKLRIASRIADEALAVLLSDGIVGRTEREVALELELRMRRLGAESTAFPPIVASGPHGALPHAEPREEKIARDVLVTIDWGARHEGYHSDCTRTYATGEGVSDRAHEIYDLVLRAQQASLAALMAGPSGPEIDAVAREVIDAAGHGEHFGHGLGHGVGLEIHEGPRLSRTAGPEPLLPGHVVTVEPGIYVPGELGVRIEDLAVVREGGHEVLTSLPKELTVVS